jgi:hypothetical protein
MPTIANQRGEMSAGAARNVAIDYTSELAKTGELLTGTPTITEVTTSDLTLSNKAVSTASLTILGETVAIGKAVQFKVSAGSGLLGQYTVRITVSTDATPAQTFVDDYVLDIR